MTPDLKFQTHALLEKAITQALQSLVKAELVYVRCASSIAIDAESAKTLERQLSFHLKEEVKSALLQGPGVDLRLTLSTSHTVVQTQDGYQSMVVVVGVAGSIPIGIDLESCLRSVHPRLESRILCEEEKKWNLAALEAWVIKEAGYKAFPDQENTVVSQYQICFWDSLRGQGELRLPKESQRRCFFALLSLDTWVVALARVTD